MISNIVVYAYAMHTYYMLYMWMVTVHLCDLNIIYYNVDTIINKILYYIEMTQSVETMYAV